MRLYVGRVRKIPKSEVLFWPAYIFFLIFAILQTSFYYKYFMDYYNVVLLVCITLLVTQEIYTGRYTLKTVIGVALFMLLMVLSLSIGQKEMIVLLAFVYCGRNVSFERIAKVTVVLSVIVCGFVILSAYLGIIQNYTLESSGRTRQYLGFRYALFMPAFFSNITLLEIYRKKESIRIPELVILFIVTYWLYQMTRSRLAFYIGVLMIIAAMILKCKPYILSHVRFIRILMIGSFVIFAVLMLYLTVTYNSSIEWKKDLNNILAQRLAYGQRSLLLYGVSLFPQRTEWVGNGLDAFGIASTEARLYVDCLYIQILQRYGIIFFVAIIALLTAATFVADRNRNDYLVLAMFFIAMHFAIDDLFLRLQYNTFWFIIGNQLIGIVKQKRKNQLIVNHNKK